jgi:hypothetical protein
MRRAAGVTLLLCGLAVVAVLVIGALQRDSLAFTPGVGVSLPAVPIGPGQRACQGPLVVPPGGAFDRIAIPLGTYGQPGPPLSVAVRDAASGRLITRGAIAGGYPDFTGRKQVVTVDRVGVGQRIAVCLANDGDRRVAVYGNGALASRTSSAKVDGQRSLYDMTLVFRRSPRSVLSMVGDIARRAALFKISWAGPWTLFLLAAAVLALIPALLTWAVRAAEQ